MTAILIGVYTFRTSIFLMRTFISTENHDKVLSEFGIKTSSILKCDDFLQDYSLHVIIAHE